MARLNIGTMGWSYNYWIGNFYPENISSEDFLTECLKHFNTVEVNSTFYHVPSKNTLENWVSRTPMDFVFSSKLRKIITHKKMLENCEEELDYLVKTLSAVGNKLGPLLIQLPPWFKADRFGVLHDFLATLPNRPRFALEVRNASMLDDRLYSLLRERNIALAIVDNTWMPKTYEVTSDFVYSRWEGDRKKIRGDSGKPERDRSNEIKRWAERVRTFLDKPVDVFGYFSKHYSGHSPTDARTLLKHFEDK